MTETAHITAAFMLLSRKLLEFPWMELLLSLLLALPMRAASPP
jgi:hypothetical protein